MTKFKTFREDYPEFIYKSFELSETDETVNKKIKALALWRGLFSYAMHFLTLVKRYKSGNIFEALPTI